MIKWLADVALIGVATFVAGTICVAVQRKTIMQMIAVVAILMALHVTVEDLTPVFRSISAKLDSWQRTADKLAGKDEWIWPLKGQITQGYNDQNHGIDIAAPSGTPVTASKKGVVESVTNHSIYGLTVIIKHNGGYQTLYAHLSQVLVKDGYAVLEGDKIALSGNTGEGTGPHLHFEIRKNGTTMDPIPLLHF
ncbi:M23 family metallopeptidase [Desulfosporosinus fructosivorans]